MVALYGGEMWDTLAVNIASKRYKKKCAQSVVQVYCLFLHFYMLGTISYHLVVCESTPKCSVLQWWVMGHTIILEKMNSNMFLLLLALNL